MKMKTNVKAGGSRHGGCGCGGSLISVGDVLSNNQVNVAALISFHWWDSRIRVNKAVTIPTLHQASCLRGHSSWARRQEPGEGLVQPCPG